MPRPESPPLGAAVPAQLEVGYVARAHGLAGEIAVKTFDPASETLFDVERVVLRLRDGSTIEFSIDSVRAGGKEILLGLEGVEGRNEAEWLVGSTVLVRRDDLGPLAEGELFQADLIGMTAIDQESGAELGQVAEVWQHGEVPNVVIRGAGKPELILPFVDEFVPVVDLAQRRLVVRRPEYTE